MTQPTVAIVAGGQGTRLRHLPGASVKVLAPVGAEPFLAVLLRRLHHLGAVHAHLCLGHGAAEVTGWLARAPLPLRVTATVEDSPLGVFGALRLATPYLSDPFVLVYGDVLPATPPAVLAASVGDGTDGVVAAWPNADQGEPSNLLVRDGRVVRYEKGTRGLTHVDVGISAFARRVVESLPHGRQLGEQEVLHALAERAVLAAHEVPGPNLHVGDPEAYAALLGAVAATPPEGAPPSLPALLLLDRDGVLLRHVDPYILRPADVRPVDGALDAAAAFARAGVRLAVVTNQSPIARGLVDPAFVDETNDLLTAELAARGVLEVRFYVCPHDDTARCGCRKPLPGLLLRAAADARVAPARTWMAGDHDVDMLAALHAGCGARVHLRSGRQPDPSPYATHVVSDLRSLAAAAGLLSG